jgi:hypothetical protein
MLGVAADELSYVIVNIVIFKNDSSFTLLLKPRNLRVFTTL